MPKVAKAAPTKTKKKVAKAKKVVKEGRPARVRAPRQLFVPPPWSATPDAKKQRREAVAASPRAKKAQRPEEVPPKLEDLDLEAYGWVRPVVQKITLAEVQRALRSVPVPRTSSRSNVSDLGDVESVCLGAVTGRNGAGGRASSCARHRPALTRFLARFGRERLPPGTCFSSIQINHNLECKPHVDDSNWGTSHAIALGDFTGGELWTLEHGATSIANEFFEFDGSEPHATMPFKGERYSLVYFVHRQAVRDFFPADEAYLTTLGFPLPNKRDLAPPTRPCFVVPQDTREMDRATLHVMDPPPKRVKVAAGQAAFTAFKRRRTKTSRAWRAAADRVFDKWRVSDEREATQEQLGKVERVFRDDGVRWFVRAVYYDLRLDKICVEYYDFDAFGYGGPPAGDRPEFTPFNELLNFATWLDGPQPLLAGAARLAAIQHANRRRDERDANEAAEAAEDAVEYLAALEEAKADLAVAA